MIVSQTKDLPESDVRDQALRVGAALKDIARHLLEDIGKLGKLEEPTGRAILGMTAEVLLGLAKGLDEFTAASQTSAES